VDGAGLALAVDVEEPAAIGERELDRRVDALGVAATFSRIFSVTLSRLFVSTVMASPTTLAGRATTREGA
jgi:hypothetical protein